MKTRPETFKLIAFILAQLCGWGASAQQAATAMATINDGYVTGVTITDGGSGYTSPPNVSFIGGGGAGASALAEAGGGSVTNIIILSAGSGYSSAPVVEIDPPPAQIAPALLSLSLTPTLTISGTPWSVQQIQYARSLGGSNQWNDLTNVVLGSSPYVFVDTSAGGTMRFYRVVTLTPPGPDPARWAWINPGSFLMGSSSNAFDASADEFPQTEVTFTNGFWMDRFEVTQWEYTAVVGSNPSINQSASNQPVENVS